jgi:hypothetical protein
MIAVITPKELADEWNCSERRIRKRARELGACHIIGNTMFLTNEDINMLLEDARPCPSDSTKTVDTGGSGAPLMANVITEAREELSKIRNRQSKSKRSSKRASMNVVSLASERTSGSQKP